MVKSLQLRVQMLKSPAMAITNYVYLNPEDAKALTVDVQSVALPLQTYVMIKSFVYVFQASESVSKGGIGLSALQRRILDLGDNDPIECVAYDPETEKSFLSSIVLEVDLFAKPRAPKDGKSKAPQGPTFSVEQLAANVERMFGKQFFTVGQKILFQVNETNLTLYVKSLQTTDMSTLLGTGEPIATSTASEEGEVTLSFTRGVLMKNTKITIERAPTSVIKLTGATSGAGAGGLGLFNTTNLNPESLGVGGLDKEFMDIVRRTLASRLFPASFMKKLGVQYVKGIILYGPPGTGKTLMARTISRMLNGKEPKIASGPEFFDKYVGETEKKIRELFQDAVDEYEQRQEDSDLHVIVIDEIDALCRTRGSSNNGTNTGDNAVNQLLAVLDGVNALNNVLLIGMTNRIDMIDEALLRPGRLEVHIEVNLPDENGRLSILRIHTRSMSKEGYLGKDVSLESIAKRTKNFTGAELAGLVKSATSFALTSKIDFENLKKIPDPKDVVITNEYFERALAEVKPAYGIDEDDISRFYSNGIISYSKEFESVIRTINSLVGQVRTSTRTPLVSCLLHGLPGSGKTALAVKVAVASGFPFVKLITPDDLIRVGSESARCSRIVQAFEDAYKSSLSVVVIDNIERLLDYVPLGPRFSNTILQALLVLVKKTPPKQGRKILVIGTTSSKEVLADMNLFEAFNASIEVPLIRGPEQLRVVLSDLANDTKNLTPEVIDKACQAFGPDDEVPVKKLIMLVETACQESDPIGSGHLIEDLKMVSDETLLKKSTSV